MVACKSLNGQAPSTCHHSVEAGRGYCFVNYSVLIVDNIVFPRSKAFEDYAAEIDAVPLFVAAGNKPLVWINQRYSEPGKPHAYTRNDFPGQLVDDYSALLFDIAAFIILSRKHRDPHRPTDFPKIRCKRGALVFGPRTIGGIDQRHKHSVCLRDVYGAMSVTMTARRSAQERDRTQSRKNVSSRRILKDMASSRHEIIQFIHPAAGTRHGVHINAAHLTGAESDLTSKEKHHLADAAEGSGMYWGGYRMLSTSHILETQFYSTTPACYRMLFLQVIAGDRSHDVMF